MSANKIQKLDSLKASLDSLTKKINALNTKKKAIEKQIKDIEEREFMSIIRANDCTVVSLNDDLALIKLIKDNNLSQQDVIELINDLGGQNNNENS